MTQKQERIIEATDNIINKTIIILCLLLLFVCAYSMYDAYLVYNQANDDSILNYKPQTAEMEELYEVMPDAVAWITIDDTNIDYPVVQGQTNADYLNTDPYGHYSLSGSIFLDSRNSPDFSDPYSLIYGHHMEHGYMFGSLDDFRNRDYFDSHRTGTLIADHRVQSINLFAVIMADASVSEIFNPEGNNEELLTLLKEKADVYIDPGMPTRVIGLSTCASNDQTTRLIVFGVLTSE